MTEHPECEKLNQHTDEWNVLFPFLEWLSENKMCISVWRDPEMEYETMGGEIGPAHEVAPWILEHPYPMSKSFHDLLYEYFGVDSHKLEMERREILKGLGMREVIE